MYEAIDYHEEAEEGTLEYPKRFVKFKVGFQLSRLSINIQYDFLSSTEIPVLCLMLDSVNVDISQRPAASNFKLEISMENLSVTGLRQSCNEDSLKFFWGGFCEGSTIEW